MTGLAAVSADPLGILVAFGAGILSFLSPCVLPLVPGYLSMVSGLSAAELAAVPARARPGLAPAVATGGTPAVGTGAGVTAPVPPAGAPLVDRAGVPLADRPALLVDRAALRARAGTAASSAALSPETIDR
ncbi:MAG TPA: cytochrome c biogenesis protein CcdA [Acidimicrobiales bacterium]|nr:cytochrome c biogenesis protein CcdA [Acidimicrobiales bacterium]